MAEHTNNPYGESEVREEDVNHFASLLKFAGINLQASTIGEALLDTSVPHRLSAAVVETLSDSDRRLYDHESTVLIRMGRDPITGKHNLN